MQELADIDLIRQYAEHNSQTAFTTLVTRHADLVYSTAMRKTGNAHAAEEITQTVFIILSKKAHSLRKEAILPGWLYQTTRLTAANFLRNEIRRVRREQEAFMQSLSNETDTWGKIAPLLDDAMGRLSEKDRNAIVLRFFEEKSFHQIGIAFGGTENAAKKRVIHALEKLRVHFSKRGIALSCVAIAGAVSASSVQAAPVGIVATVTATVAKGTVIPATITTLVKGTMKTLVWLKFKVAICIGVTALIVGGVAPVALSGDKHPENNLATVQVSTTFAAVPNEVLKNLGIAFLSSKTTNAGLLTRAQADRVIREIEQTDRSEMLGSPRTIGSSGNGVALSSTRPITLNNTNANVGITLEVLPTVLSKSGSIRLVANGKWADVFSRAGSRDGVLRIAEFSGSWAVPKNQTLLIFQPIEASDGGNLDSLKTLLIFVTPSLVDDEPKG